jgi:excisionase family DNA binding protein
MTMPIERRWLSVHEAGLYFGLNAKTIYSLAARKRLPAGSVLRLGRQLRIDVSAIEAGAELKRGQR